MPDGGDSTEFDFKQGLSALQQEQAQLTQEPKWTTGIKSIDAHFRRLLRSRQVLGLASTPTSSALACLSSHIICTFLLKDIATTGSISDDPVPTVFVITSPSSQTTLAIATLLDQRLSSFPTETRPDSVSILASLQILQYLSISGLTESVADVSAAIYESASEDPTTPKIILLQGLSATLTDATRRHGATQTAAITANLIRSLKHLSRTYANLLILVELDVELQKPALASSKTSNSSSSTHPSAIDSAFTSSRGEVMCLAPSIGASGAVAAVLEGGMDVIVAVHDGFGKTIEHDKKEAKKGGPARGTTSIVEVVKDREGGAFGKWCLWVQ